MSADIVNLFVPKSEVYTNIGGQRVKLTNLDKILFPGVGVSKAEVIQYYLEVSDILLQFIDRRPLTLIRFPDGVKNAGFYAKSKPTWTPDWMETFDISHTEETISYLLAHSPAAIIWIANLGGLEIHPMQFSSDQLRPDHFIFDLDPPENYNWEQLIDLSLRLKSFLREHNYQSFIKTSGSKGLHLFVPIIPQYEQEEMVASVKKLAGAFVDRYPKETTLHMNKDRRKGKLLLDIFRNHRGHTTVAPYSMRGKKGAPISMPFRWADMETISSSQHFTIRNYKEYLEASKEAWAGFFTGAAPLHDHVSTEDIGTDSGQLNAYHKKRDFGITNEPKGKIQAHIKDQFVVQLHDASRLHYDLRLQVDGVLWSWAIPKGLPHHPDVKRLAIRTEDHPIQYLDFEGTIPKGEYGAGEMWVFARGSFVMTKNEEKKITFSTNAKGYIRSYLIYKTGDDEWIIERKEVEKTPLTFVPPMLAQSSDKVLPSTNYHYEVKWDGIRVVVVLNDKEMQVFSRSGRDITKQFPELDRKHIKASNGIFDGELVCLDTQGRPVFSEIISRMHRTGEKAIKSMSISKPVYAYLFDCCNLEGKDISDEPIERRRAWLEVLIKRGGHFRFSETVEDGAALFEASKLMNLEGVMAKRKESKYESGIRSTSWYKIKVRNIEDCIILGYTKGQGDRSALFGSLHLAKKNGDDYLYLGRVGTGFDSKKMKMLLEKFSTLEKVSKYIDEKVEKSNETIWLEPVLTCEVQYASITNTGHLREPVFVRLKKLL